MNWFSHLFVCDFKVRSVQSMVSVPSPVLGAIWNFDVGKLPGEPVTQVLRICKVCGKMETQTLQGTWTMNDLKGAPNAEA